MAVDLMDVKLLPFWISTVLFFLTSQPVAGFPEESVTSAFLKALPIWSLAFYVYSKHLACGTNERVYPSAFFVGLLLSSIGDILIIWQVMFNLGVAVFAVVHVFYLIGIKSRYNGGASSTKQQYVLITLTLLLFVIGDIEPYAEKGLCVIYFGLLCYLSWMASALHENEKSKSSFYVMLGMCLFMSSDCIIVIDRVTMCVPCSSFIINAIYYAAQVCLAVSTVQ